MKNLLTKYNCLLIHCFTIGNKNGNISKLLAHTIKNTTREICCSTLTDGDTSVSSTHADIGVIVAPGNVTYCCSIDGGTLRMPDGSLVSNNEEGRVNPDDKDIEHAIVEKRQSLNEFLVSDYCIKGVFAIMSNPSSHYSLYNAGGLKGLYQIAFQHNLPLYVVEKGHFFQIEKKMLMEHSKKLKN